MTSSPPIHLLYIDDDDVDVMAMKRAIAHSKTGFSLLVARDGIEALALLRGQGVPRPHIVLLDLNMPRMNGIEFLRQLREDQEHRDAVVFVLTTSSMTEDKAAAYDAGIAGYIQKTSAGRGLLQLVELLDAYCSVVELP